MSRTAARPGSASGNSLASGSTITTAPSSFEPSRAPSVRRHQRGGTDGTSSRSSSEGGLLAASSGRAFQAQVKSWGHAEVTAWLDSLGAGGWAAAFEQEDITGAVLLDVDQDALKQIGVQSVGDRIKIFVGIKQLRSRCIAAAGRPISTAGRSIRPVASNSSLNGDAASGVGVVRRSSSRASGRSVPPPLHLHQSSTRDTARLGQAEQEMMTGTSPAHVRSQTAPAPQSSTAASSLRNQLATSAGSGGASSSASLAPPSAGSAHSISPTSAGRRPANSPRLPGPPSVPAPRGSLPPPPGATVAAEPSWQGQYGLPRAPNQPTPPRHGTAPGVSSASSSHRRVGSLGAMQQAYAPNQPIRPATSQGTPHPSAVHQISLAAHPYATASSPTYSDFGDASRYSSTLSTLSPPSMHAGRLGSPPHGQALLSPINETSFSSAPSPIVPDHPTPPPPTMSIRPATANASNVGFSVGRAHGGFSRPSTAGGQTAATAQGLMNTSRGDAQLNRQLVKFIEPPDSINGEGTTKTLDLTGATDAIDILTRVLRKFNKLNAQYPSTPLGARMGHEVTEVEGYAIFATTGDDGGAHALTDAELVEICRDPSHRVRSTGLAIRRLHTLGAHLPPPPPMLSGLGAPSRSRRQDGGMVPVTRVEPSSPTTSPHSSPQLGSDSRLGTSPYSRNNIKRASTVSIMSGLGLDWPPVPSTIPQPRAAAPSSPTPSPQHSPAKGIRRFLGARPPSELITNHLPEYFPSAEPKLLNKTRHSIMRRSIAPRPQSQWSQASGSSWGDNRLSIASAASLVPELPSNKFAPVALNERRVSSDANSLNAGGGGGGLTAGALELPAERSRSRSSVYSSRSTRTRDSDNASLLTVDEITAEVEQRRMSVASYAAGEDASALLDGATTAAARRVSHLPSRPQSIRRPSMVPSVRSSRASIRSESEDAESDEPIAAASFDEDDEIEEDEEESTDEDEDEDEDEDDVPEKVTSTGTKAQIKWIKGAVIGAGSFGTVSLGMDAKLGTLMAVKQVELPTGNSANEERKKSMLQALEREIDILKTLTHPHIVTYLDSSTDGNHLNIFLEYVPGGSVSGLLSNYGAFEEVLVCKWITHVLLGVVYLHDRDIIHRDLKGANILVDNKGCVKISDFGISRKVNNDILTGGSAAKALNRVSLQGSVFWMAPEVVKQTPYTYKADIWSIGCVTLEMLTGSHPFPKLNQMQAIWKIGSSTAPDVPSDISAAAEHFLKLTFAKTAADRPSAHELLQTDFVKSSTAALDQSPSVDLAVTPRTAEFPATPRHAQMSAMA